MLLFGVESANQETLDMLNKGFTVNDIIEDCRITREVGSKSHITIVVGYSWETRKDALRTLKLAKMLMEKGWGIALQYTIVMPYPRTKLYEEAIKNG